MRTLRRFRLKGVMPLLSVVAVGLAISSGLLAEDAAAPAVEAATEAEAVDTLAILRDEINVLWTCLAAFLVFFMQAGFALVEAGMTRAKNVCNILMKNLTDFGLGTLVFWLVGFGLMFGVTSGGFIGTNGFMFNPENSLTVDGAMVTFAEHTGNSVPFSWAFLIFQTVFAATAATIISGAMAERTKFSSYLVYSAVMTAFVYPVFGHWAWGSLYAGAGWLEDKSFHDFAGSTVVHSVGGWAALAGAIVLGPRLGKYSKDGKVRPILGHNMALASLGVFILWLGWFGFNPGSTTAVDGGSFAQIAVNTNISAAAGSVFAMLFSWILFKKPDTTMSFNGALAGLVGITAGCDVVTLGGSLLIGAICGFAVVLSVLFFDKIKVDDPVGAISVHGVCGAIGTLMTGVLVAEVSLGVQLLGVAAAFFWTFPVMLGVFLALKYTIGLRVSEKEEIEGLDLHEHGNEAYPKDISIAPVGGVGAGYAGVGAPAMARTIEGAAGE